MYRVRRGGQCLHGAAISDLDHSTTRRMGMLSTSHLTAWMCNTTQTYRSYTIWSTLLKFPTTEYIVCM